MAQRKLKTGIDWKKYFFELVVIVTGITLSFALQNWQESKKKTQTEIKALKRLHADLQVDTTALWEDVRGFGFSIRGATKMLNFKDLEEVSDSFNLYFGSQLQYTLFTKSDIAYQQLRQAGGNELISNPALLEKIIEQYAIQYRKLDEYGAIDKMFTLQHLIPFFHEKFPYVENFDFVKYWDEIEPVLRSDVFRNMLRSNANIKFQVVDNYRRNLENIESLMVEIEKEIKRLE